VVGQATGDQDDVAVGVQGDVAQRPALADVDLELDVLLVLGKGRRERTLPFGRRAGEALDRYLRARARHNQAALPWLGWGGRAA
jgi:site-specific recombinase XerC